MPTFIVLSQESGDFARLGEFDSREEATRFASAIPHLSTKIVDSMPTIKHLSEDAAETLTLAELVSGWTSFS